MAQTVAPGATFPVTITGLPEGLLGQIGIRVEDDADNIIAPRTTLGFVEFAKGNYRVAVTAPTEAGYIYAVADFEGIERSEQFLVSRSAPEAPEADVPWTPSVEQVAALIRARTKIPGGGEAGTFTEQTRPTREEVETIIVQAVDHVSAAIGGDPCNDRLEESARASAALLAAILIETSYWPEQAEARGSSAARLESLFNARLKSLTAAVAEECGGQGTGDAGDGNSGAVAAGGFNDGYPLIGRDYPPRW